MSNQNFFTVTPSDTVNLPTPCGLIWVGVSGDVAILESAGATAVTLTAVPVGWLKLPFAAVRVMATNTTATNMTACPKTIAAFSI